MKTSKNVTVTEGRTKEAIFNVFNKTLTPQIKNDVKNAVENERIKTGVITKYYPYLDKAEVKLDETKKTVLCKILHRFGGDMIDFYTPLDAEESYDETLKEPCIIPKARHNVCVLQIHDDDSDENLILGYYQDSDVVGFKPATPGNVKLMSITEPNLYWVEFGPDGLNLRLPKNPSIEVGTVKDEMENGDVYTKKEVDEKLKNNNSMTYRELLETTEDYQETLEDYVYTLFRGDCWTINNNYESSAAITTKTNSEDESGSENKNNRDFTVTGTFRTDSDLIGIYWNSKDLIEHPYISYGSRYDYRNVVLEFDYEMQGCRDWSDDYGDTSHPCVMTVTKTDGSIYYFVMYQFITGNHVKIDFNNLQLHQFNTYVNSNGDSVVVESDMNVSVNDVESIMFMLKPQNDGEDYTIIDNVDFSCEVTNITVKNGYICNEHNDLEPHQYRLCEGYDDFYNFNPKRICREMRKLGYTEWCDLYIGASHFYEKSGEIGDRIPTLEFNHVRTGKMVLNKDVPLNKAFRAWLDCYSRELKKNDCPNLVISVSMENLQCPDSWKQRDCNGNPALTEWVPSTFFYSPCNDEVAPYMQSVSEACLDIVVANGMQPILQMGEAWWWWNENDKPNQPPCFYDNATKLKYQSDFGHTIPEYNNAWSNFDEKTMQWLNQQLCKYSDKLSEVVKSLKYTNGLYMALFFPPSVLDNDRVPPMMQNVNFLKDAYNPSKLDVLQIEDYDWVTGNPLHPETMERDRSHHPKAYTIGQELGFTEDRLHYFGGFVQYPENAKEFWRLIKNSMDDAIEKGFQEVFVWAGSQVRRDKKILGYDGYEFIQDISSDVYDYKFINNASSSIDGDYVKKSEVDITLLDNGCLKLKLDNLGE